MKTCRTHYKKTYVVTPTQDGTISTPEEVVICNFTAGNQCAFVAPCDEVECTDDNAIITRSFNFAPLGMSATGGSVDLTGYALLTQRYTIAAVTSELALAAGMITDIGTLTIDTDLSGLSVDGASLEDGMEQIATAELWFCTGDTVPSITWPESATWIEGSDEGSAPTLESGMAYCVVLRQYPNGPLILNLAYCYDTESL